MRHKLNHFEGGKSPFRCFSMYAFDLFYGWALIAFWWNPILIQANRWPVKHPNQWYWSPVSFCQRICVCWCLSSLWSLLFAGCLIWLQYVWEFSTPLDLKTWDQSASEKLNPLVTAGQGGWLVIFRCKRSSQSLLYLWVEELRALMSAGTMLGVQLNPYFSLFRQKNAVDGGI